MPQGTFSQDAGVLGVLAPVSQTTSNSPKIGYVSLKGVSQAQFILNIGVLGSGESLTAALNQALDTNGTSAKVFSPAKSVTAITSLTSNVVAVVNLNADELDVANGFTAAALLITLTSSNASLISGVALQNSNTKPPVLPASVVQTVV